MPSERRRVGVGLGALAWGVLALAVPARGQVAGAVPSPQSPGGIMRIDSIDQLVGMGAAELDQLYRQGAVVPIPDGPAAGRALYPDARWGRLRSRLARVAWQGKVFRGAEGKAVNRFFGARVVRADVYPGPSWLDGGPAIILDYSRTSLVYRPYRDEIREIAPGLFLGRMYARTQPEPTFKMYFALDTRPRG
jgi:hypothetical protein